MKIMYKKMLAKIILPVCFCTALVSIGQISSAVIPTAPSVPTINVIGTAEQTVAPDFAVLQLGVSTYGDTVRDAKVKNDRIMSDLLKRLANQGVSKDNIRTSNFSVNPNYDYDQSTHSNTPNGYNMSNSVTIKIEDFGKIAAIIDEAAQAGISQINYLNFDIMPNQTTDDNLTATAIANAQHKAEIIAKSLGLNLGPVQTVDIHSDFERSPMVTADSMRAYKFSLSSNTPIEKGILVVSKRVSITYQLR